MPTARRWRRLRRRCTASVDRSTAVVARAGAPRGAFAAAGAEDEDAAGGSETSTGQRELIRGELEHVLLADRRSAESSRIEEVRSLT
ncbi:MAG: hypothetical protein U9R72_11150 [Chloroflexota bacterium]|nr:hypothetical protein [Chloroflexota bacterium]